MRTPWFRWYYALALLLSLGALGVALTLQYQQGLMPCALCQLQRLMFLLTGLSLIIALTRRLSYRLVYNLAWINTLWCAFGLYFALRQLWLIDHIQGEAAICGAGVAFLFTHLPWGEALKSAFLGTGDCAVKTWSWLGISLPGWCAINYVAILILSWLPVCCRAVRHWWHKADVDSRIE